VEFDESTVVEISRAGVTMDRKITEA